jgi:hypothetical protein
MSVSSSDDSRHSQLPTWRRCHVADKPGHQTDAGRWGTIRYALDSTGRTARLCAITLVAGTPPAVITLLLGFHH